MQLANVGLCSLENALLQPGFSCLQLCNYRWKALVSEFLKPGKCLLCDLIVTLRVYLGHPVSPLSP